jgi:hypothetical protein
VTFFHHPIRSVSKLPEATPISRLLKRNEALQFTRLLMPLQRIDELDVDLRMRQSALGQRVD